MTNERSTALVVGGLIVALGGWEIYRDRPIMGAALAAAGSLLAGAGLFAPAGARRFHAAWMKLARMLGYLNTRILLGAMFFLMMTAVGAIRRLLRSDPLQRRGEPRDSYWIPRPRSRPDKAQFEHLF